VLTPAAAAPGRGDKDTINSIGLSRKHLYEGLKASLSRLSAGPARDG
jgi:hypothetical protein